MANAENIVFFLTTLVATIRGQNMPIFMGPNTPMTPGVRPNFATTNQFRPPNRGPQFRGPGGSGVPQFSGPGLLGAARMSGPGRNGVRPGVAGAPQFPAPGVNGRPMQTVRPVGPGPVGPVGQVGPIGPSILMGPQQQQLQQQSRWAPGEPNWVFPSTPQQWRNSCQRTGCSAPGTQCVFWRGLCPTSVRRTPCRCERGCKVDDVFIPFGQSKVMDSCNNICACYSREGLASCTARRC